MPLAPFTLLRLHSPLPFDSPYYTGCQFVCETSRVFVIFVASPAVLRGRYRRRCRPVLPAVPQASSLSFLRCCRRRHRLPCGAAGVVFIPCLCDACAARAYSLPSLSPCGAAGVVVVVFPAVLQASSSLSSLRCCRRRRRQALCISGVGDLVQKVDRDCQERIKKAAD